MKAKTIIIFTFLILLFLFEIAIFSHAFLRYTIIFNLLIIISSVLSIDEISKKLFFKFNYLNKNKKNILIISNTILICSSVLLLFLSSVDSIRDENALNKIRSMEIKTEISIPTESNSIGVSINSYGVRNFLILSSSDSKLYKFESDDPILSNQVATNTRKLYVTYRPSIPEEILGKQIEILDQIKTVYFNFNNLIDLKNSNDENKQSTSTIKFSFFINSIQTGNYSMNSTSTIKTDEGKFSALDMSRQFGDIGARYDNIQKSKVLE